MKLETLTIRPEEAHILLNHIADENVEISLPHLRTLLLTINYRTRQATLAKEQIKSLEQLQRQLGLPPLASEAKLWDALHSAGAIQPANIQQLISEIERAGKFDPQDPRQRVIAVDTNILYNATLSNAAKHTQARPPILISSCILREISRQLSRKENPLEKRDQNKLMQALQTPQTLKQLVSEAWCTARRRATAAAREIEKLRRTYPLVYTKPRRCAGDPSIVEDYANPPIPAANITLATFDRGIVSAARVHGLKTLLLHPPPKKLEQISYTVMGETIYHLAANYGLIKVAGEKGWTYIQHSWPQLQDTDAVQGTLRLHLPPQAAEKLAEEISQYRMIKAELAQP